MRGLLKYVSDPETGKQYPIPAGGSDNEPAPEGQPEGTETEEDPPDPVGNEQEEEEEEIDYSHAKQFLEGIEDPEVLRQLDPYVRKWDAGVTRRFQELHSQLRPYQELGDPDTLNQAAQLYQIMQQDPKRVYEALKQAFDKEQQKGEASDPQQQQQQAEQTGGLPPDVQERFDKLEKVATWLASQYQTNQQKTQQQQEDEALEEYLGNLKTEFGDFNEKFVLSQMMAGMSGEDAVKEYQKLLKDASKQATPNAPQVLSGGGSVAREPIEPGKLSNKDTQALVAQLMEQSDQETKR